LDILPVDEARDLTWTDTYYADNNVEGVIAVFDVDYQRIRRELWRRNMPFPVTMVFLGIFMMLFPAFGSDYNDTDVVVHIYLCFGNFWLGYYVMVTLVTFEQVDKMSKAAAGFHVAVTTEGLRMDMKTFLNQYRSGNMFRTTTIVSHSYS
jgi:hypothetical protein